MEFCSERLPIAERTAGYAAALKSYFSRIGTEVQLHVSGGVTDVFTARLEELAVGRLTGAIHRTNSPHVLRAEPLAPGSGGLDLYLVSNGQIRFTVGRTPIDLVAGDLVVLPAGQAFVAETDHFEMLALGIPAPLLGRHPRHLDDGSVGRRICGDTGLATCLGALLRAAAGHHQNLSAAEGAVLQTAIVEAVLYWGGREPDRPVQGRSAGRQQSLDHIKAMALCSLQLPTLNPTGVANDAGVSVRTLHRLFSASGSTFREWLRDCRLARCWMEVTSSNCRARTIAAIAFEWGFSDLRTFNRAFSARYGVTPREARQGARTPGES